MIMPLKHFILIFFTISVALFPVRVKLNPIPIPSITLAEEHINIELVKTWGGVLVRVVGIYPFSNEGYEEVTMYFPVPLNVDKNSIKVYVNDSPVSWEIVEQALVQPPGGKLQKITYYTILGRYLFLKWTIKNPRRRFVVRVEYNHPAVLQGGALKALYAMATGRFYYSKTCTAYVNITFRGFQNYSATIELVGIDPFQSGQTSFKFTLRSNFETCQLVERAKTFQGLDRDDLIVLRQAEAPAEKWEATDPSKIRLAAALKSFNKTHAELEVNLTYPHAGFKEKVKTWKEADIVHVDINVLEWTGPAAQVVTTRTLLITTEAEGANKAIITVNGVEKAVIELKESQQEQNEHANWERVSTASYLIFAFIAAALILVFVLVKIRR
ncbi:MAG: hypothetical protein DRJ46_03540 [Thermoprotei archaeon]|nr:MAG: hypothetical protein DRJ46_03540 [Thermoprotei archaeon]